MKMTGTVVPEPTDYLETLLRLGQLLNSRLEIKDVLDTAMEQVIGFLAAERGFIVLVDVETGRVWGEAVHEIDKSAMERTLAGTDDTNAAEISRTLVEYVLDSRQPVVTYNAMEDPRFASRQSVQLSHLRSVLCIPLVTQQRLLGIIYLDNRLSAGIFSDTHLAMLSAFGNQAAVAIENARLYENLRRSLEDRLKLQDELHSQETQRLALEEASRLKSDFIGFLAHELRNPLTTIRGYVQTLMADTDHSLGEEVEAEFYEAIEADADRLLDMINELLDVSRLEAGKSLTLAHKEVNLRAMLDKLARRHRFYKYFTVKHSLNAWSDDTVPEHVVVDEDKLNQIMSNLLSNAIKYSPDGGEILMTTTTNADGDIIITIKDCGVGLSEEQIGRLFQQYERVERESIRSIPGTGLGLYLVKHLIELHGGDIECKSEVGSGSCFIVRLPRDSRG